MERERAYRYNAMESTGNPYSAMLEKEMYSKAMKPVLDIKFESASIEVFDLIEVWLQTVHNKVLIR